ncbi:MAG: DUF1329 domain-containing protein [Betaproteobacteria bacterium]|nr:DUF1329 domain-containing protein [Betaproteobacteria bacterium]
MQYLKSLIAAALSIAFTSTALAAVTAQEAQQLGKNLTPTGAEKAGNADGTIPEWTGGLTTPPAGFQENSLKLIDPYGSEKPRLSITSKDIAANADKLTEGTKQLLRRYPTMRVDVYPTHRPIHFPLRIIENTKKNAFVSKTTDGGEGIENVMPGYPFPIPKTGYEVMWNHLLNYRGLGWSARFDSYNVGSDGKAWLATTGDATYAWPMYDPKKTGFLKETESHWKVKVVYVAPARRAGEAFVVWDYPNALKQVRRAWQYLPGQRRVKLAPEIAYDTPNPQTAGTATYDDASVFNGAMDRFDFKLVGKKEMYIPYDNYKYTYFALPAEVTKPGHINPDMVRWELHRVWVVEATLKPGKRHIYSKRVFYIDEDSWAAVASDQYDARGQLYRSTFSFSTFSYDVMAPFFDSFANYDFISGTYNVNGLYGAHEGIKHMTEMPGDAFFSPEALAGAGVR